MAEAVTVESMDEASTESAESDYFTSVSEESEPESVNDEEISALNQDGDGAYKFIFLKVYDQLEKDPALDSDVGPAVLNLLKCIKDNCDNPSIHQFISALCVRVQSCVDKASSCKLASSISARIWPAFHQLRLNADLHHQWKGNMNSVEWNDGMERWNGLLEWSTGLDYWSATPTNWLHTWRDTWACA